MRKVLKICICSLLFMQLVILTGCRAKHAIQFIVDNEEYYTIKTKGKEEISMPEDPTKSGYIFDGWYFDERGWKKPLTRDTFLDQKLEDDKKVYAKWKSVIKTIDDLKSIRNDPTLTYVLTTDIDLGGIEWKPIDFSGVFYGNDHIIKNFKITNTYSSDKYGLFGKNNGVIYNLGVEDFEISVKSTSSNNGAHAGGLVGSNYGTINNSYATGNVTAETYKYASAGGLVGENEGTISNCYATGNVTSTIFSSLSAKAGGLVGSNSGTISNSYATGTITSTSSPGIADAGGLVGFNYSLGIISNSYATGNVSATTSSSYDTDAGGLVGSNYGTISNSYATGNVTAKSSSYHDDSSAGGLVGENYGNTISNSYRYSGQIIKSNKNNMNSEGVAKLMEEITSVSFYTNTLGWDESIWEFTEGSFPKLKK